MKAKRILALFLAVVTCLSLAVSASAASISDFKDVDTKAWYAEAVTAAVDNGLLYGKSKTQLDPNGLLTRAEMAAITNRSFGCYKTADISAYKDVAKSKWYYKDVALAVQMGTYNGVSASSMQPDRAITRQEAIAVVARALQLNLDDYEEAVSLHTDYTSPEYLAFEKKLYEKTLRKLGFGKLLPEERAPQKDMDKRKEKVEER